MEFRLTYEGPLLATANDRLKPPNPNREKSIHNIRREMHSQLAELWTRHPILKFKQVKRYHSWSEDYLSHGPGSVTTVTGDVNLTTVTWEGMTGVEAQAKRFSKCGFRFVPLVCELFNTVCSLAILFIRREDPGHLITS